MRLAATTNCFTRDSNSTLSFLSNALTAEPSDAKHRKKKRPIHQGRQSTHLGWKCAENQWFRENVSLLTLIFEYINQFSKICIMYYNLYRIVSHVKEAENTIDPLWSSMVVLKVLHNLIKKNRGFFSGIPMSWFDRIFIHEIEQFSKGFALAGLIWWLYQRQEDYSSSEPLTFCLL